MGGEVKRSALSCLTSSSPRRGGAGSARPQRGHGLDRGMFPLGHRLIVSHPVGMGCPGLRPARIPGRGDRAPPRKSLFASFPALCRQAVFSGRPPAEGRAPHARKEGIGLTEGCAREATGLWPHHRVEMKCLGIRTAVPCGRGDRAPPRKSPLALSPGFPRKAIRARLSFAEGRALHALEEASGLAETCALLPTGSLSTIRWEWDARACAPPVFAGAETAPLRDNDPRAIPGLPPQGDPSGPAHPPEGRAPHARKGGFAPTGRSPCEASDLSRVRP
jgi:hypothetical protein